MSATPLSASLNFSTGQMRLRARLASPAHPSRVWLWAFFLNPTENPGSRSDQPIELTVDWRGQDTVTVTGAGPFHWWNIRDVPKSGYYAKMYVSAVSAEAVQVRASQRDKSMNGAVRVR